MLQSQIHVDLPSEETERKKTLLEWVRATTLGHQPNLRTGIEEITVNCSDVVRAVMACFYRANIHNVIALLVDGAPVFLDTQGHDNDAQELLKAALAQASDSPHFGNLSLVAEHRIDGLHVVINVAVASCVSLGDREVQITLSARPEATCHIKGESAEAYAQRLIHYAHSEELPEAIKRLESLTSDIAHQFQEQIGIRAVIQGPVEAMLVRPPAQSVNKFDELDFVSATDPIYQPIPTSTHPDIYQLYFADPLYEFQNFILIAEVIEHHVWAIAELVLLEREGRLWGTGDELEKCDASSWHQRPDLVYCSDGTLVLTER